LVGPFRQAISNRPFAVSRISNWLAGASPVSISRLAARAALERLVKLLIWVLPFLLKLTAAHTLHVRGQSTEFSG
jgi:hypothetical protein